MNQPFAPCRPSIRPDKDEGGPRIVWETFRLDVTVEGAIPKDVNIVIKGRRRQENTFPGLVGVVVEDHVNWEAIHCHDERFFTPTTYI
jgi:hypothetical protein